ncbi:MAG: preprotein translocase subunit SecG [Elusimicrobiota bacterium]|nr:preprotein translocase subunit SecG [Elusimicrobiota bacterium]
MFYMLVLGVHVLACVMMVLFVLLQTGRGAGLGVLGGGGGDLINTPTGSSFMKKFTAGLAATFAFTSLFLTLLQSRTGMSSVTNMVDAPLPVPSAPATPPAAPAPAPEPAKK